MVRVCVGGIVAEAGKRYQGSRMTRGQAVGSIVVAAGEGIAESVVECCCMEVVDCFHRWRHRAFPQLLSLWNRRP